MGDSLFWLELFARHLLWLEHRGCGRGFTVGIAWDTVCEHEIRIISWCLHIDDYRPMLIAVYSAIYKHRTECVYSTEKFPCIKNTSFLFNRQVFDLSTTSIFTTSMNVLGSKYVQVLIFLQPVFIIFYFIIYFLLMFIFLKIIDFF